MKKQVKTAIAIAKKAARYQKKVWGDRCSKEDTQQDAVVIALTELPKYDPSKGTIGQLLAPSLKPRLTHRVVRTLSPVTTRREGDVKRLPLQREPLESVPRGNVCLDQAYRLRSIQERMTVIARRFPDGEAALQVLLGLKELAQAAEDAHHERRIRLTATQLRTSFRLDPQLLEYAYEP